MEGQPQDDGLIGLHPLLPQQKLNIWKTKIIITQAVHQWTKEESCRCSILKRNKGNKSFIFFVMINKIFDQFLLDLCGSEVPPYKRKKFR